MATSGNFWHSSGSVRSLGFEVGVRTNGVAFDFENLANGHRLFDHVSVSVASFNSDIYRKTMGRGIPPRFREILNFYGRQVKVNVVLCPETVESGDIWNTITYLSNLGIPRINLREPYGQPRIGCPFGARGHSPTGTVLGQEHWTKSGRQFDQWKKTP